MSKDNQPVSKVIWVHRDNLYANDYNPNNVFRPEMRLLKLSLLEDGWTLPLVVRQGEQDKYEIIDGFHRWTLSGEPDVYVMTDGFVPVVVIEKPTRSMQIASTIRYNRARGIHHLAKMADIVFEMSDEVDTNEIQKQLGMEAEEVERLLDRGNMKKRGSKDEFNNGRKPALKEGVEIRKYAKS